MIPIGSIFWNTYSSQASSQALGFLDPSILNIVQFTLVQAIVSTAISAVLGTGLGFCVPFLRTQKILSLPYCVPTVVAAQVWIIWLGRSGILSSWGISIDWMYTMKAVVLAHVFFNIPWVALAVSRALQDIPRAQLEIAETLGAGLWTRFRTIIWPYIRWAAVCSWIQVFGLCTMSFGLVLILGGDLLFKLWKWRSTSV
jgi:thiamine transport system permease protein